jgi:hypothetical protein
MEVMERVELAAVAILFHTGADQKEIRRTVSKLLDVASVKFEVMEITWGEMKDCIDHIGAAI